MLFRLMLGVPDTGLFGGITVPAGATFTRAVGRSQPSQHHVRNELLATETPARQRGAGDHQRRPEFVLDRPARVVGRRALADCFFVYGFTQDDGKAQNAISGNSRLRPIHCTTPTRWGFTKEM